MGNILITIGMMSVQCIIVSFKMVEYVFYLFHLDIIAKIVNYICRPFAKLNLLLFDKGLFIEDLTVAEAIRLRCLYYAYGTIQENPDKSTIEDNSNFLSKGLIGHCYRDEGNKAKASLQYIKGFCFLSLFALWFRVLIEAIVRLLKGIVMLIIGLVCLRKDGKENQRKKVILDKVSIEIERLSNQIQGNYDQKNYAQVISDIEECVSAWRQCEKVTVPNDDDASITIFAKARLLSDTNPKEGLVCECYVRALWSLQRFQEAVDAIDTLSVSNCDDIQAEYYMSKKEYAKAEDYYKRAGDSIKAEQMKKLRIAEEDKVEQEVLELMKEKQHEEALRIFESNDFLKARENSVDVNIWSLWNLSRVDECLEAIEKYSAQFNTHRWDIIRGHACMKNECYEEALKWYESGGCSAEAQEVRDILKRIEDEKKKALEDYKDGNYNEVIRLFEDRPKWKDEIQLVETYIMAKYYSEGASNKILSLIDQYKPQSDPAYWEDVKGSCYEIENDYMEAYRCYEKAGRKEKVAAVEQKEIDRLMQLIRQLRGEGKYDQIIRLLESSELWSSSKEAVDIYLESVYKQEGPSERLFDLATQYDGRHHCNQWQQYKAYYLESVSRFSEAALCYKAAGMEEKHSEMLAEEQKRQEEERRRREEEERRRREEEERRRREEEERRRREEEERRRREEEERRRREEEERKRKEEERKVSRMKEAIEEEDWYDVIHLFENDTFYQEHDDLKEYYVTALVKNGDYDEAYEAAQKYRSSIDEDVFYICKGYYSLSNDDLNEAENYFRWGHATELANQVKEAREASSWGGYGGSSRSEHNIQTGKRGGQYYINSEGNKVYINKNK